MNMQISQSFSQESLIGQTQRLKTEAAGLVATINAPRVPRSPGSKHTSMRLDPPSLSISFPGDLEEEGHATEEVDAHGKQEIDAVNEEKNAPWKIPSIQNVQVNALSKKDMQEVGKEMAEVGLETAEVALEKGKEIYDYYFGQNKERGDFESGEGARREADELAINKNESSEGIEEATETKQKDSPVESRNEVAAQVDEKPLKKKASFVDNPPSENQDHTDYVDIPSSGYRNLRSGGSEPYRRQTPGVRPVSREDVVNMIIPPFSPGGRSSSGTSDQARISRPISREVSRSGSGLRTPGSGGRMLTPGTARLHPPGVVARVDSVTEQDRDQERDDSTISSLRDDESVDSAKRDATRPGTAGKQGAEDEGDDDSRVSSLNSTDQALIGDLRKGLEGVVGSQGQGQGMDEQGGLDTSEAPDGVLGEGVASVVVHGGEDEETAAIDMPLDLSEFNFATGSFVNDVPRLEKGLGAGLVVSPSHDHEFTDAMAVRPRTNERPSSTQQKYLDMYARAQSPIPLDNLEGLELEIGPEPQSARSVNSQLTMSSLGTMSVRSHIVPLREKKAPRASFIPFPFQQPPGIPHVDSGITTEKLKFEEIKKPFLTQNDELHNQIREKLLRKQEKKRKKIAVLMEVERRRKERDEMMLADFTREEVSAAMHYFRTVCSQLRKEAAQRKKPGNNQADDGTVSTANTSSSVGSDVSKAHRRQDKAGKGVMKKPSKKGLNNGHSDAASFKGEGRYAPAAADELRLDELEAVFRKFRRAKINLEEEEHGRGLLLSLEWLLDEMDISPMEWFDMVDSRGGTKTGDKKLTYLELERGVDMLCEELGNKMTDQLRAEAREAREKVRKARRASIIEARALEQRGQAASPMGGIGPQRIKEGENSSPSPLMVVDAAAVNAEMALMEEADASDNDLSNMPPQSPSRVKQVQVPPWRRQDLHALLKYLDPNGDGDISVCEMKLAFRNLHLSPESKKLVEGAGPIITRMVEYMKEKQLTVKDLFMMIDTDRSMTISTDELFRAMNTFFKKKPTEEQEEIRMEKRAALAALDLESSGSLDSADELSLGLSLGTSSLDNSVGLSLSASVGTRGWADVSLSGVSRVSSRFGPSMNTDVSSSWQPRGNLNSRGKHVYLKKSVSSVILHPLKTRKKRGPKSGPHGASMGANASSVGKGTAESSKNRSVQSRDRTNTASTLRSDTNATGARLHNPKATGTSMYNAGPRAGLPAALNGLGRDRILPRAAKTKLQQKHRLILDTYSDLFDRQYDELSVNLPAKESTGMH